MVWLSPVSNTDAKMSECHGASVKQSVQKNTRRPRVVLSREDTR